MSLPGFTADESQRALASIRKLEPYLSEGEYCYVGGLAIRWHLVRGGHGAELDWPFNDLDLIATSIDVIDPAVTREFWVSHCHLWGDLITRFYLVLVDPETRLKIDVFPWADRDPERAVTIQLPDGRPSPISRLESQLVATVNDLRKPLRGEVIDPKQLEQARLLESLADHSLAEAIWQDYYVPDHSLIETIAAAEQVVAVHPELAKRQPYRRSRDHRCAECVQLPQFPLTPLADIYDILSSGFVE